VRRRPTASRKPKKRLANPTHLKRSHAPKAARRSSKQTDLARLTRELGEALEQQAATAEILRVISSSPTDLKRVFAVVAASATRLCDASDATIHQVDDAVLRLVAHHGPIRVPGSLPMTRGVLAGRAVLDRQTIHVADLQAETREYPQGSEIARHLGLRTNLAVPLIREGEAFGVVIIRRTEVRPFTERQIDLVKTFATQAVIALENTRLFEEAQARTRELSESLQQQTATADVLKVISRSAFDLQAVLDTLIESAVRLCEADMGSINRQRGDVYRQVANFGHSPALDKFMETHPLEISRGTVVGRTVLEGRTIHIADVQADPEYAFVEAARIGGLHTMLGIPLLREGTPIGVIVLQRKTIHPFTEKQIGLATTFADQAVIAIENVRLFDEVQARTRDLSEALEQQTATGEILASISGSVTDTKPVFEAIVRNLRRLLGTRLAMVQVLKDGMAHLAAAAHELEFETLNQQFPRPLDRSTGSGRAMLSKQVLQFAPVLGNPDVPPLTQQFSRALGINSIIFAPMIREDKVIGVIGTGRRGAEPFDDKQIALIKAFADQAVIAVENVRLFDEVQARTEELSESLQQQTATADVLKVISRSAFDLQMVLATLTESAAKLCEAEMAAITRDDGQGFRHVTNYGFPPDWVEFNKTIRMLPGRGSVVGRALMEAKTVQVVDVLADAEYTYQVPAKKAGYRTFVAIPLMREGKPIGVLTMGRKSVAPFTDKQIEIVSTFADQAVIAIENVRLFDEVQARTRELARSVEELRALGEVTQAVNSTLDLETVLSTIVAKAVQLSNTDAGVIYVFDELDETLRVRATYGLSDDLVAAIQHQPAGASDALRQAIQGRKPLEITDIHDEPPSPVREIATRAGFRARLVVPLVGTNRVVGALVIRRKQPGKFPTSTVELLQTFAAQSVLAIQNARLFSEIEEKSRQLQLASEHKSQFLASMSHELRTPLNAIIGLTEMMVTNVARFGTEKTLEPLRRVNAAGTHLLDLINEVLDLSKIEAGKLELNVEAVDLARLIDEVIGTAGQLAEKNQNRLIVEAQENVGALAADSMRLKQILLNLLSNACKFTK
jgi:GAF domain-containing protein